MATPKSTTAKKSTTPKTAASAKPVVAKSTATPKAAKTTAAKAEKSSTKSIKTTHKISPEERYRMVEVAAYFLAERNHFAGNPVEYWSAAEAQISKLLAK
ncbi:DUF2934 domain-containing protein [Methylobacillus gramineus]|uniref:DUF2934 domain-containing protein n=1 Tax=Methylobacillus gramineus TaxID=755169 RepID=UPI001CFFAED3|nr:DUF2934 domain-containing protein [Methylobacillus gramineus]MCB5184594.1 DUF2934 domain-containing protein [Methylobacillus gramineus]